MWGSCQGKLNTSTRALSSGGWAWTLVNQQNRERTRVMKTANIRERWEKFRRCSRNFGIKLKLTRARALQWNCTERRRISWQQWAKQRVNFNRRKCWEKSKKEKDEKKIIFNFANVDSMNFSQFLIFILSFSFSSQVNCAIRHKRFSFLFTPYEHRNVSLSFIVFGSFACWKLHSSPALECMCVKGEGEDR